MQYRTLISCCRLRSKSVDQFHHRDHIMPSFNYSSTNCCSWLIAVQCVAVRAANCYIRRTFSLCMTPFGTCIVIESMKQTCSKAGTELVTSGRIVVWCGTWNAYATTSSFDSLNSELTISEKWKYAITNVYPSDAVFRNLHSILFVITNCGPL